MKISSYVTNAENYYIKYDKVTGKYIYVIDPSKEGVCHCDCDKCDCDVCKKGCLQPPEDYLDYSINRIENRISDKINNIPVEYCGE